MNKTKMAYFEQEDILHLEISDGPERDLSIELSPNITAELNDAGELIGIEILNASALPWEDFDLWNHALAKDLRSAIKPQKDSISFAMQQMMRLLKINSKKLSRNYYRSLLLILNGPDISQIV